MGEKISPITGDCSRELQYIGLRIQYFRKMRNLTQAQLAEKVNINKNYLSQVESGSTSKAISLPLLIQISKALNVDLSILVDLNDLEKSTNEIRQQLDELKSMFDEIKQFNADLDSIMSEMNNWNK